MKTKILLSAMCLAVAGATYFLLPEEKTASYTLRSENKGAAQDWLGALEYYQSIRANQAGIVDPADVLRARNQVAQRRMMNRSAGLFTWEEKGPDNIGGRTRAILVDRSDPTGQTVWAGSVSGGLFKSTDGAGTWTPVNDLASNLPNTGALVVSCLAQGPAPDYVLYMGTGSEWDGPSGTVGSGFIGAGMFKSIDKGASWQPLSSTVPTPNQTTPDWVTIERIAVDQNTSTVYAALKNGGIRFSTDGGTTWTSVKRPTNCNLDLPFGQDVMVTDDSRVLAVSGGALYISDTGTDDCSYTKIDGSYGLVTSSGRMVIAVAPSDNNIVWAATENGGEFSGLFKSTDKGSTFTKVLEKIVDYFEPCISVAGQCRYDFALAAYPSNPNAVIIGGVQLWRWDGNLTRLSAEFGGGPYWVHSDKHWFEFDPFNSGVLYIGSDGGVTKSLDNANTFFPANRGYITTQFYSVAYFAIDMPFGGTQDNGTILIPGEDAAEYGFQVNTPLEGITISGGDGFDCDASQINGTYFTTIYWSRLARDGNPIYNTDGDQNDIFYTRMRLWESRNDPYSQDSITFKSGNIDQGVGTGDGFSKTFGGTISPPQSVAKIVPGSFSVTAGLLMAYDSIGDGVLKGDISIQGNNYVSYNSGSFEVTFSTAPSLNTIVYAHYAVTYDAGDVLHLISNVSKPPQFPITFEYTLPVSLTPGDSIKIQDPYQSMVALGVKDANANPVIPADVYVARNAINLNVNIEPNDWMPLNLPGGVATCIEFSKDGKHMFVGQGGTLRRIDGLEKLYDADSVSSVITTTPIASFGAQTITGIAVNENDPETLIVTLGNYNNTNYVYLLTNCVSTTGSALKIPIQGDLVRMPVYDAEIDYLNPNIVLIGTEFGVWSTDLGTVPYVWTDESDPSFAYTPVFDVRQQRAGWKYAENDGVYYLGTHGRGIWKSESLVGIDDEPIAAISKFSTDLLVYPNPMSGDGYVKFNLEKGKTGELKIFDLNGRLVKNISKRNFKAGTNTVKFDTNLLPSGTYFVTLETDNIHKVAKFVVLK